MTKPKPRPVRAIDAVRESLISETAKREDGLKPIEIVKTAICAYQDHANAVAPWDAAGVESSDKAGLRRGTQAAVDRLLFNANYWLAAYETRIVEACEPDAQRLLKAVTVWSTHTLKLNNLSNDESVAVFERFCPPLAVNNRRVSSPKKGRSPIAKFESVAKEVSAQEPKYADALAAIVADMKSEAAAYVALPSASALDALYSILPVWCLQDKIALVSGDWWNDCDVMLYLAEALKSRFLELGYGDAPCQYFYDSMLEAIDAYQRDISSSKTPLSKLPVTDLIAIVHAAREAHPNFETDGYGDALPAWLVAKEQLIWNVIVCSLYGPRSARPLLISLPALLSNARQSSNVTRSDIISDLAKSSFKRYGSDRAESGDDRGYKSFSDQPQDLRNSSIAHIKSIPAKLDVLGFEIVPDGSCYPEQRITSFSPSEVECLAILEHRRWLAERKKAGWVYGDERDVDAKKSPYLVPWEDLPDRAREWNRSAVRSIPALLAGENLAIARK